MANSLIITTPGGSTSNSFCTLAEAETYIAMSFYDKTAWNAISDDAEKENLLILFGMVLNNFCWIGWEAYDLQAMAWPRWMPPKLRGQFSRLAVFEAMTEAALYTEATAITPEAIKKAQAWGAYDVMYRALRNRTSPNAGPATDAIKSISLFGDVSISFDPNMEVPLRDIGNFSGYLQARSPEIWLLLSPYVSEINYIGSDYYAPDPLPAITIIPSD